MSSWFELYYRVSILEYLSGTYTLGVLSSRSNFRTQTLQNPLNAIPGPWYAKFTSLPGTIAGVSRLQVQYHHRLHQLYGSFVRTGPRQLFVGDIDAFKFIHKIGTHFDKAEYYHFFGPIEAGKPPYGLFQIDDE